MSGRILEVWISVRGLTVVRRLLLPVATGVMLDIKQLGGISPVVPCKK